MGLDENVGVMRVCCLTLKKKVAFGVRSKEQNFINLKFNSKATYTIDISTKVINTSINRYRRVTCNYTTKDAQSSESHIFQQKEAMRK